MLPEPARPHRPSRVRAPVRRLVALPPPPCDHLHETTSRYDHAAKVLRFLLVCPVCKTEKVIHTLRYEPRFEPHGAAAQAGANVHRLPARPPDRLTRRAA